MIYSYKHIIENKYMLKFEFFFAEFVIKLSHRLPWSCHQPIIPHTLYYMHHYHDEYFRRENENGNLLIFIIIVSFVSTAQQTEMLLLFCYLIVKWIFFHLSYFGALPSSVAYICSCCCDNGTQKMCFLRTNENIEK